MDVKLLHGLSVHFDPSMGSERKAPYSDHVNSKDSRLVEVPEQRQRPQQAVVRRSTRYEEILGTAKAIQMLVGVGRRSGSPGHRGIALVCGPKAAPREQPGRRDHALKRKETIRLGLSRGLGRRDDRLPFAGGFEQILLQAGLHESSIVCQYPILGDPVFPGEREQGRGLVIRRRRDNPEVRRYLVQNTVSALPKVEQNPTAFDLRVPDCSRR